MALTAHQILGVHPSASVLDIKGAYRRLAQINHPDRCKAPGATEALSAVNVAYSYLTKGARRPPVFTDGLRIFRSTQECEQAMAAAAAPKAAPKPRGKLSCKDWVRMVLESGRTVTATDAMAAGYGFSTFQTAVSDLRSAKYCGKGKSPLNIRKWSNGAYWIGTGL